MQPPHPPTVVGLDERLPLYERTEPRSLLPTVRPTKPASPPLRDLLTSICCQLTDRRTLVTSTPSPPTTESDLHTMLTSSEDDEEKHPLPPPRPPSSSSPARSGGGGSSSNSNSQRKRPRYLTDIDRSLIIQRLKKGEKQADLAREFGVTRAAICHINKNRDEVLTRFDLFAKTPKGRVLIENYTRPSTEFANVTEVRTATVSVLTTRLRDATTAPINYRSAANRLIRILLEEALVSFSAASSAGEGQQEGPNQRRFESTNQVIEVSSTDGIPGAVALGSEGRVMLDLYTEMEPNAVGGLIRITAPYAEDVSSNWHVMSLDLPQGLTSGSVLLLCPICSSSFMWCTAIEELIERGVDESRICIVTISCSAIVVREVSQHYPGVHFITTEVDKRHESSLAELADFARRYQEAV